MLAALIPALAPLATGYLSLEEKAVAKQKLAVAKIEAQVTKVQSDAIAGKKSHRSSSTQSLKDEAWTICFIVIIAAAMVPDLQPYIKEGFRVLKDDCPEWLSWGILASIAASFGLKSIGQFNDGVVGTMAQSRWSL